METRTRYREFRDGAVRIVREIGRPIAQVAREHRTKSCATTSSMKRSQRGHAPARRVIRDMRSRWFTTHRLERSPGRHQRCGALHQGDVAIGLARSVDHSFLCPRMDAMVLVV
jgi:hypothetical protein